MKEEKSKADILIEMLDKALIENGLEPTKKINKKGSLIILPGNRNKKNKEKHLIIASLLAEVHHPLLRFFDFESDKRLDDKIEVLTALKNGKTISEIPKFYDILELYPGENEMWD